MVCVQPNNPTFDSMLASTKVQAKGNTNRSSNSNSKYSRHSTNRNNQSNMIRLGIGQNDDNKSDASSGEGSRLSDVIGNFGPEDYNFSHSPSIQKPHDHNNNHHNNNYNNNNKNTNNNNSNHHKNVNLDETQRTEQSNGTNFTNEDDLDFFDEQLEPSPLPEEMTDSYMTNQMEWQLSRPTKIDMKQLEKSQLEIHGIIQPVEETPELVERSLAELDRWIDKLKCTSAGRVYKVAEQQNEGYVNDRNFRLMFLRAEGFESPKKSSRRMLSFFEKKKELWGEDKLCRPITLQDFNKDDLEALENGHFQLLPTRDLSGRVIVFHNVNHLKFKATIHHMRACWYMMMEKAALDEHTQKSGYVHIIYKEGPIVGQHMSRRFVWASCKLEPAVPMKMASMHICFGKQSSLFCRFVRFFLTENMRLKIRPHEGTFSELVSVLCSFGIPKFAIPLNPETGEHSREYHALWLQAQRALEQEQLQGSITATSAAAATTTTTTSAGAGGEDRNTSETMPTRISLPFSSSTLPSASNIVGVPTNNDVILGRGKRAQMHPANLRLRFRLEELLQEYDRACREGKGDIVIDLISDVKTRGGRFLKLRDDGGTWETVPDRIIRKKIAHDFRTVRKSALKQQQQQHQQQHQQHNAQPSTVMSDNYVFVGTGMDYGKRKI